MTVREAVALVLGKFVVAYNANLAEGAEQVWAEALSDLNPEVIVAAGEKVLREYKYPGLPAIGVIREAALELAGERVSPSKAWAMVRNPENWRWSEAGFVAGLNPALPPAVREAAKRFGLCNLEKATSPHDYDRFKTIYEEVMNEQADEELREKLPLAKTEALPPRRS
jgi:hypothetical protein